jgi:drug/metabolite transporter (DMT)-like permease
VIALILGVVFLSERPGIGSIIGLVLILGGSRVSTVRSKTAGRATVELDEALV